MKTENKQLRESREASGICANEGCGHEPVRVVQRERDFAHPAVFVPGDKKNVVALAQHLCLSDFQVCTIAIRRSRRMAQQCGPK